MASESNSFKHKIYQRRENDNRVADEAQAQIDGAVKGRSLADVLGSADAVADSAIASILMYYHCKQTDIPDDVTGAEARLDCAMKPSGIMRRTVELTPGWRTDALGAYLAIRKDTGQVTALIPKKRRYTFHDTQSGKTLFVTRKNEDLFENEAICFYEPFPQGKLGRQDLFRFFLRSVAPHTVHAIIVTSVLSALLTALIPALTQILMGDVVNSGDLNLFLSVAVFLIASAVSGTFITTMKTLLTGQANQQGLASIQAALMMRVLNLPVSFFGRHGTGDVSCRMAAVDTVWNAVMSVLFGAGVTSVASLIYVVQLFTLNDVLCYIALGFIVVMIGLTLGIAIAGGAYQKKMLEANKTRSSFELEMITGVQKVKLAGAERRIFSRWADRFSEVLRLNYNQPRILKYGPALVSLAAGLGTAALLETAAYQHIDVATFYAFMSSYGFATAAFVSLSSVAGTVTQAKSAFNLLVPFFEEEPEVSGNQQPLMNLEGRIDVSHVSFRYSENSPLVLNDLSLTIEPGEYVAIVGKTGCGKSTLMRILLGFESPERGAVLYDGRDLTSLDKSSLRRSIGVVLQNAQLVQGDLRTNITLSHPEATMDDAWEAAEIARIADDIRAMPMGMHTLVGNTSSSLSGGQRQRVAIARAVVGKPKVLLLDEATSALDNQTQHAISEALDDMDCTRIVIAHRLSTIRQCDRVVVLDEGHIVADGTFDEVCDDYLK